MTRLIIGTAVLAGVSILIALACALVLGLSCALAWALFRMMGEEWP